MCEKVCWTCGHFAFGCFVTGNYNNTVQVDDTCEKWCPEGTKGTVTDYEEMNDGTTWAENEYLKDDLSNL
ncbi:MAG: hypothetical protein ABS935_03110 [Solibacillus sp.]|uniref:hypothetical protein n=1 Tax=Solibacillus sp. TaxID=1909654 RepID=UPI00331486FD